MSFSVGIVGLPNVGKSTLFKALTRQPVDISNYPFCTINPNVGIVEVPDQRLKKLAEVLKPPKATPTVIKFTDIAGLVRGAHEGQGLGNQFLSHIQEVDAILEVARVFEDPEIQHVEKTVDPIRDIEIIKTELILRDLKIIEKFLEELKNKAKTGEKQMIKNFEAANKVKAKLEANELPGETLEEAEKEMAKTWGLITMKPIIYLFNVRGGSFSNYPSGILQHKTITADLKLEEEISELSETESKELEVQSKIPELIKVCYDVLGLITFYTIKGGEELRAWTLAKGLCAPEAGGVVHSDFKEKFIRAEVINWEKLAALGSWNAVREKGQLKTAGRDYMVEDGDVMEFKT